MARHWPNLEHVIIAEANLRRFGLKAEFSTILIPDIRMCCCMFESLSQVYYIRLIENPNCISRLQGTSSHVFKAGFSAAS